MEEAAENSKESSYSAHGNGMNERKEEKSVFASRNPVLLSEIKQ
jgi:hypothetical protein